MLFLILCPQKLGKKLADIFFVLRLKIGKPQSKRICFLKLQGETNYKNLLSYVEPNPELYGRLASLSFYTLNGLEYLNLLSKSYKIKLNFFIDLLIKIKTIS